MDAAKRAEDLRRLSVDAGATPAERALAARRLEEHLARHPAAAERPQRPQRPPLTRGEPVGRWQRLEAVVEGMCRARAPDGARCWMHVCTTRKPHRCAACHGTIPKGARAWRPIVYNGRHRMDRFCRSCWEPGDRLGGKN